MVITRFFTQQINREHLCYTEEVITLLDKAIEREEYIEEQNNIDLFDDRLLSISKRLTKNRYLKF